LQPALILAGALTSIAPLIATGYLIFPGIVLPGVVRFACGAAIYSTLMFLVLFAHAGYLALYLGAAIGGVVVIMRGRAGISPGVLQTSWFYRVVSCAAGAMYLIVALAPETEPDAATYHLRIVADCVRLHAFSDRATFFDVLPHGLEVLFVPAMAVGGVSAPRLVHLAFLIACALLIREIARELGLPEAKGNAAAALFLLAPVCGVDGTSAYSEAALACACCAVVYLLIRWKRERSFPLLACAAINAAFCYSIKPTFGWVALAAAIVVVIAGASWKDVAKFAAVCAAFVAPWLLRSYVISGNPVAPFLSAIFPNNIGTADIERRLAAEYSAFRAAFSWRTAFADYTIRGGNQGIFGPAFLFAPFGLMALKTRAGRVLAIASVLLAVPFFGNTGARFLMPAAAPATLMMAAALPAPLSAVLVAVQAVAAAPPVQRLYNSHVDWGIKEIPIAAAFRIEPESAYLRRRVDTYGFAEALLSATPPGARIFSCTDLPEAYVPRHTLIYWHSLVAQRITDALNFAMMSQGTRARLLSWRWQAPPGRTMRITALTEMRLVDGGAGQTWRLFRPGESFQIPLKFGVAHADFLIWPGDQARLRTDVAGSEGLWSNIDAGAERSARNIDIRGDVTNFIKRLGFDYIAVPVEDGAFAAIGRDMLRNGREWRVEAAARSGSIYLFRL
jgi:hypothetical protein